MIGSGIAGLSLALRLVAERGPACCRSELAREFRGRIIVQDWY